MINKTAGIVLNHIPFKETSIIARIYTREFGYHGFIVNSVRSSKSRKSMAFFEPLSSLDLVVYFKGNRELQRLSEYRCDLRLNSLDIRKQTVLLFLAEVLDKLLRNEQTENPELFDFIRESLLTFSEKDFLPNFHIQLLLQLTPYLGLSALSGSELFQNMKRVSGRIEIENFIQQLINTPIVSEIQATGELRTQSLEELIQFFQHHIDGFGKVNSLKVLSQIFR